MCRRQTGENVLSAHFLRGEELLTAISVAWEAALVKYAGRRGDPSGREPERKLVRYAPAVTEIVPAEENVRA